MYKEIIEIIEPIIKKELEIVASLSYRESEILPELQGLNFTEFKDKWALSIARQIVNSIAQKAVVLTRDEYENYEKCKDLLSEFLSGELVIEDTFFQQNRDLQKESKETAKYWLTMALEYIGDLEYYDEQGELIVNRKHLENRLIELAQNEYNIDVEPELVEVKNA